MAQKVYLGRDNKIYPVLKEDGEAYNSLASITKMTLHFGDTVISSDDYPNAFDWDTEENSGEVAIRLGTALETESVSTGTYRVEVYVFDASNTNGVFWDYINITVIDLSE